MSSFQKIARHTKKQESITYTLRKKQARETANESEQIPALIEKDFKTTIIYICSQN